MASDGEILNASIAAPERFEEIFERHFDAVHAYLRRRVRREDADDIAADTFLQAFRLRSRFERQRQSARPWLLGIATNIVRHHLRQAERQSRAVNRVVQTTVPAATPSDPAGPRLVAALDGLSPEDLDVLLLYAWADLEYREIAEALNVPVGTVRSRLNRVRTRLRSRLNAAGASLDPPGAERSAING